MKKKFIPLLLIALTLSIVFGFFIRPMVVPDKIKYVIGDEQIITTMQTLAQGIHNKLISDGFKIQNKTIPLYYTVTLVDITMFERFARGYGKMTIFYSEEYGIVPRLNFWFMAYVGGNPMYFAYRVGF